MSSCRRRGSGGVRPNRYTILLHKRRYARRTCFFDECDLFADLDLAIIGAIEELSQSTRTRGLVRDQFETNFFGPVNIVKTVLPSFRARKQGHIILLTAISTVTEHLFGRAYSNHILQLVT